MAMVAQPMTFMNLTFLLGGKISQDLSETFTQITIKHLLRIFRNQNHVVLAIPDCVFTRWVSVIENLFHF